MTKSSTFVKNEGVAQLEKAEVEGQIWTDEEDDTGVQDT